MKIAYICRGIHPGCTVLVGGIKPDIIYIGLNIIRNILNSFKKKYDILIADGFTALRYSWLLKKAKIGKKLVFITASPAVIKHKLMTKIMLKDVDGVIAISSLALLGIRRMGFHGPIIQLR